MPPTLERGGGDAEDFACFRSVTCAGRPVLQGVAAVIDVALNIASLICVPQVAKRRTLYSPRAESYSMIKSCRNGLTVLSPVGACRPYLNAERNDGFVGSDHGGTSNEVHVGVGRIAPTISGYAQAGPAYLQPSVGSGEIEFSGKAGASVALGESTSAYGEVSFVTGDSDNSYGIKTGIKHSF